MKRRSSHQDGFTLIELLTVLVIIGLMTSVVVLAVPKKKSGFEKQSQAMYRQFTHAAESAIIGGKPQAFGFYEDAYLFYEFDGRDWVVVSEDPWPDDLNIQFFKEDIEIELPEEPVPIVVFEPVGLSTPFSLWLEGAEDGMIVSSEGDGRVNLERDL